MLIPLLDNGKIVPYIAHSDTDCPDFPICCLAFDAKKLGGCNNSPRDVISPVFLYGFDPIAEFLRKPCALGGRVKYSTILVGLGTRQASKT